MKNHAADFKHLLKKIAGHKNRYDIFRDFISVASISINNAVAFDQELENHYFDIIKQYDNDTIKKDFTALFNIVVDALEVPQDFLGALYMDLNFGNAATAQFFTPYEVSKLLAKLVGTDCGKLLEKKSFIKISDPACGSAGTIIAFADIMQEDGFNPQKQLWVQCIDVDPTVAKMAYIQLALLGIPGEVIIGNSLTMNFQRVMRTPMHFIGFFDAKFLLGNEVEENQEKTTAPVNIEGKIDVERKITPIQNIQMDLIL